MRRSVLLLFLVVVGACSATGQHDQDGGGGSGGVAVAGDGGPGGQAGGTVGGRGGAGGAGGGHGCGAHVCTSSEICVRPSCGGAPPQCTQLPDGGQCSSGWTYRPVCNNGPTPGPGCEAPPCVPPAPFCITRPASCGATPTCACFPTNVCQSGGACGLISDGEVLCASA